MRALIAGLALAALAGPVLGQSMQGENLLVGLPQGFKVGYQAEQGPMLMHELVPQGESVEDWSKMVTIQVFRGLRDMPGELFAGNLARDWAAACANGSARKLTDGTVNGFPFVLWAFTCPLNPQTQKPETMYLKGISGSDAYYAVQYAFRAAPDASLDDIALPYLVEASACDTRKPERACPEGM